MIASNSLRLVGKVDLRGEMRRADVIDDGKVAIWEMV